MANFLEGEALDAQEAEFEKAQQRNMADILDLPVSSAEEGEEGVDDETPVEENENAEPMTQGDAAERKQNEETAKEETEEGEGSSQGDKTDRERNLETGDGSSDAEKEEKKELEALRAQIAALEARISQPAQSEAPAAAEEKAPAKPTAFVTNENFAEIISTPEKLNEFANAVMAKAKEETLRDTVAIAERVADQRFSLLKETDAFWKENEDLKATPAIQKYLSTVFSETHAANPTKSYGEILKMAGEKTRMDLNIARVAQDKENARRVGHGNPKPALAGGTRGGNISRTPANATPKDPQKAQMADIL